MQDRQLATEMSLSWCGIRAVLEQLGQDNSIPTLAVHAEDEAIAKKLWLETPRGFEWVWKVEPALPKGAWYMDYGPTRVWGCRGDL